MIDAVLMLSISLSTAFVSIIINLISLGIDLLGYLARKTSKGNFLRLVFFTFSGSLVAFLYYLEHRIIHFSNVFVSPFLYVNMVILFIMVITWIANINYFKKKINMKLYWGSGIFFILLFIGEIISYFTNNFSLELTKGIEIIFASSFGFFIVINSMINNKKHGK